MPTQSSPLTAAAWVAVGTTPCLVSAPSYAVLIHVGAALPDPASPAGHVLAGGDDLAIAGVGETVYARALTLPARVVVSPVALRGQPVTYANAAGSPFTLGAAWTKVATITPATRACLVAARGDAAVYDIEWATVPAGAAAPVEAAGMPVLAGEDFPAGAPLGDLYLRSPSGQVAFVRTGA